MDRERIQKGEETSLGGSGLGNVVNSVGVGEELGASPLTGGGENDLDKMTGVEDGPDTKVEPKVITDTQGDVKMES